MEYKALKSEVVLNKLVSLWSKGDNIMDSKKEINSQGGRQRFIDAVKGFCMVLVLFNHARGIPCFGIFLTACYMQTFFIISGYTFREKPEETLKVFCKKKAKRLLIPYVVYAAGLWLVDSLAEHLTWPEIVRGGQECFTPDTVSFNLTDQKIIFIC